MKAPRTYLLLLLTVTTLGGALVAWRQYGELVELRAIAMNREERADLQKRIWELEKLNRELQGKLAGERPTRVTATSGANSPLESNPRGGRGDPRGRGEAGLQQMNAMREVLAKPEVQAMMSLQQKAGIESRYAALFRNLNVTPEQATRLTALLAERGTTSMDVFNAAREQGIDPRTNPDALRKLLADAQNEVNSGIKSVIGERGFAQLQTYEQTLPQRSLVNELQQRLSYTSTPLTTAQSEQLIEILAANPPPRPPNPDPAAPGNTPPPPGRGPGFSPPGGGRGPDAGAMVMNLVGGAGGGGMIPEIIDSAARIGAAPVTSAAIAQAQTVLAPPQVSALQQIQQQQQAQQQLQQVFRNAVTPTPPAGTSAPAATGTGPLPTGRQPRGGR